jgi:drug/metabolite transporter (DMT)-like permease
VSARDRNWPAIQRRFLLAGCGSALLAVAIASTIGYATAAIAGLIVALVVCLVPTVAFMNLGYRSLRRRYGPL